MIKGLLAATAVALAADGVLAGFEHTRDFGQFLAACLSGFSDSFHASLFSW